MTENSDLVGKKKIVVNADAAGAPSRSASDIGVPNNVPEIYGGRYLPRGLTQGTKYDALRMALGKSWEYRKENKGASFSNDREPYNVFYNKPVYMEPCNDEEQYNVNKKYYKQKLYITCNNVPSDSAPAPLDSIMMSWAHFVKTGFAMNGNILEPLVRTSYVFRDHAHDSLSPFTPKEVLSKQPSGKAFFANYNTFYNERIDSKEFEDWTGDNVSIQNMLPSLYGFLSLALNKEVNAGPIFNIDTILTGPNPDKPLIQPYFRSFGSDDHNAEHGDITELQEDGAGPQTFPDVYTNLLQVYPLETSTTLYGAIGNKFNLWGADKSDATADDPNLASSHIIQKIFSKNSKYTDMSALIEEYINEYVWWMKSQAEAKDKTSNNYQMSRLLIGPTTPLTSKTAFNYRARALENIGRNIVISPHVIKKINMVDKWKKHFPFYTELEFTAKLLTTLGDTAKRLFLTRFLANSIIGATTKITNYDYLPGSGEPDDAIDILPGSGYAENLVFANFVEEKSYDTLDAEGVDTAVTKENTVGYSTKKVTNLPNLLSGWIDQEYNPSLPSYDDWPHRTNNDESWFVNEVRNYVTFLKDSSDEFINLDSDNNQMWKSLFGPAFQAKIMEVYEKNRRSYMDIINGKKAYTEDLFYKIEKKRKLTGSDKFVTVQNILIPNTSDLDIVKYVDTQMKYNSYATYKYNVYAERVVFGAEYKYHWLIDESLASILGSGYDPGDILPSNWQPGANDPYPDDPYQHQNGGGPTHLMAPWMIRLKYNYYNLFMKGLTKYTTQDSNGGPTKYNFDATIEVRTYPSIRIVEDLMFSTPEILIMDRPPVPPDVNIVPYKSINNQIKIILSGQVSRYRQKPIVVMDSDIQEFEKVSNAQLSADGKIEFGSDDPVASFQIFRTEEMPKRYTDFIPYQMNVPPIYEEKILPNKKYYYIFRAVDTRGHVSNPSAIYEVELADEKGAVKPFIRTVEIDMNPPSTVFDECQKYFYLKPTVKQVYFHNDSEVDSIFSDAEKKKRYKIRLISKGTGKKIDINFSFTKKVQN